MKQLLFVVSAVAMLAGCEEKVTEAVQLKQLDEKRAEREASEKKNMSTGMEKYLQGKVAMAESDHKAVAAKVAEVRTDAEKLAQVVSGTMMGKDGDYATKLLHTLENADVNAIAVKYLAASFHTQSQELSARIEDYNEREAKYKSALAENAAHYATNLTSSSGLSEMSRSQREAEIKRVQKEIKTIENQLKSLRAGVTGSKDSLFERHRNEKKRELTLNLERNRRRLEILSDPEFYRRAESNERQERFLAFDEANRMRRNNEYDIDRRLRPRDSDVEIVKRIEQSTIGRLQEAMKKATDERVAEEEKLARKVAKLKEFLLAVPVSNAGELKSIKIQADRL